MTGWQKFMNPPVWLACRMVVLVMALAFAVLGLLAEWLVPVDRSLYVPPMDYSSVPFQAGEDDA